MSEFTARPEMRLAAVAGWLCAVILLLNTAEQVELLPNAPLTQLLAPLAQVFAVGLVLGLYVAWRRGGGRVLTVGLVGNLIALMGLVGVEFAANLVFPYLSAGEVDGLLAGPLGTALTVVSVLFIVATVTYVVGLWMTGSAPRVPLALYAVAVVPIGLRTFVPELALQLGLALLAVAVSWLAVALWQRAGGAAPPGGAIAHAG